MTPTTSAPSVLTTSKYSGPIFPTKSSHCYSTTLLLLLLLSRQHSKVLYRWGVRRREKKKKTQKSRSQEKAVGFSSASLFLARKREAVKNNFINYLTRFVHYVEHLQMTKLKTANIFKNINKQN